MNTFSGSETAAPHQAPEAEMEIFAAKVAHDFNNLLTAILGNIELLQLRVTRNNMRGLEGYLDGANSAGARAVAFAARLMVYSGHTGATPRLIVIDEVLARIEPAARPKLAAGSARIKCDPGQLELAVAELRVNAQAAGGTFSLASAVVNGCAIIKASDTGHGMESNILARAQELFFTTAANGTGRGLGLPIVGRVVRDLGGSMAIASKPGAGCIVTLKLPLAQA